MAIEISLIIPTLRVGDLLQNCIKSFEGQYDELIVIDDKDASLAHKQNMGLRLARGTHLIVCNDDIVADKGELKDLCSDVVLSPKIRNAPKTFHGHMFCMPREIYAKVGGFDESYSGVYAIDSDLWYRLILAGYPPGVCEEMVVIHDHPASTIKTLGTGTNTQEAIEWFESKWGRQARNKVMI